MFVQDLIIGRREVSQEDNLGDRMKQYEFQETSRRLLPGLPIYARIDGRGFSRFTRGMHRPYDQRMSAAMVLTTKSLVEDTHATIGYVQSDEISLVWMPSNNEGVQAWFDGKTMKMASVLAGLATASFVRALFLEFGLEEGLALMNQAPHFDARVISMPGDMEAANMMLWRNMDATKNAISMAASHYYSHKELQGRSGSEKQEMLWQKGINFNDYPDFFKRGTFVRRDTVETTLTQEELARIPERHRPAGPVMRSVVRDFDLPPLSRVQNLTGVLFAREDPRMSEQQARPFVPGFFMGKNPPSPCSINY
jgi:tRNA(His) 5'-end guanylyltransferase